jgi:hypothetical protein
VHHSLQKKTIGKVAVFVAKKNNFIRFSSYIIAFIEKTKLFLGVGRSIIEHVIENITHLLEFLLDIIVILRLIIDVPVYVVSSD